MPAISVRELQHSQGGQALVRISELDIEEGSIVAVLGPTGCGKTTFLYMVAGLSQPSGGGCLTVLGSSPQDASARGLLNLSFQTPVLMPWLTVAENVALPRQLRAIAPDDVQVARALSLVQLASKSREFPDALSSGMRSRVAVAQSIVSGGKLLLMDEVFGTLDEATRVTMDLMLRRLNSDAIHATILFVTHDIDEALLLSDRILLMQHLDLDSPLHSTSIAADISVELNDRTTATRYSDAFRNQKQYLESLFMQEIVDVL